MFGFGIAEQTRTFILSFGFGFLLGIVYAALRVIRMILGDSDKLIAVQDIIFSLITFFSVFNFFLVVNKGEFRGFLFLAMTLGFLLYRYSFGAFVLFLFEKVIAVFKRLLKTLLFPIRIITKPLKKFLIKIKKNLNLLLKNTKNVLYNKLRFGSLQKKIGNNENDRNENKEKNQMEL